MSHGQLTCEHCQNEFPETRTNCPHCARPQIFPNVTAAKRAGETAKLERRFDEKRPACAADGRGDVFDRFLDATSRSDALFACTLSRLHREIASETAIWETYYQLEELRMRSTATNSFDWQKLRPQAEIELLGSHQHIEKLHYACLSLDWAILNDYGDCIVKLAIDMIAHRASCFEGNTAIIFADRGTFDDCLRSDWHDRGKMATAVFADNLRREALDRDFPGILVVSANAAEDDQFIEVHVFGPMTARTFAEVKFVGANVSRRDSVYRQAIVAKLQNASVAIQD